MNFATGTRAECDAVKAERDKLMGAPQRGQYVTASGNNVPIASTWDGQGPVPIGWAGYGGPQESQTTPGSWAVDVGSGEVQAALAGQSASKLTAPEQAQLSAKLATAVDSETWLAAATSSKG